MRESLIGLDSVVEVFLVIVKDLDLKNVAVDEGEEFYYIEALSVNYWLYMIRKTED
jgi:hypothetical protein